MSDTEYLWLEERVKISDSVPRDKNEWSTWQGKCWFHHHKDIASDVKNFLQEMQGFIFPNGEKLVTNLEEILCCCGSRPTQKTVISRQYGYTTGTNLPRVIHEDRQNSLIEYFHNIFNQLITNEDQSAEACTDHLLKIRRFLDETLQAERHRVYNPSVVRLLHIIRQYLQKPLVQYTELPTTDFMRLVKGPLWEECAKNLKIKYSSKVYVDLNSKVTDEDKMGIYIEGPSLHEIKNVTNHLTKYIDLTVNPPKPKEDKKESEDKENQEPNKQSVDTKTDSDKSEDKDQHEDGEDNKTKVENQEVTTENIKSQEGEIETDSKENAIDDAKRDSKSAERCVAYEIDTKTAKEIFTRSKSVPANSATTANREPEMHVAKRAKYDSECSNDNIIEPSPMEELTLFKETLSLVLMQRLENNNNELIDLASN